MPHLYLPSEHTDADLVLAADVAAAVSSADLYVTWTHDAGPGGTPEVEAIVRDERPAPPANPFADLFVALAQGFSALWRSLTGPPAKAAPPRRPAAPSGQHRATPNQPKPPSRLSGFGGGLLGGRGARRGGRRLLLGLGRLGALAGPRLVELDAPAALLGLHQRKLRAERAA